MKSQFAALEMWLYRMMMRITELGHVNNAEVLRKMKLIPYSIHEFNKTYTFSSRECQKRNPSRESAVDRALIHYGNKTGVLKIKTCTVILLVIIMVKIQINFVLIRL